MLAAIAVQLRENRYRLIARYPTAKSSKKTAVLRGTTGAIKEKREREREGERERDKRDRALVRSSVRCLFVSSIISACIAESIGGI